MTTDRRNAPLIAVACLSILLAAGSDASRVVRAAVPMQDGTVPPATSAAGMTVVLLGTGMGPRGTREMMQRIQEAFAFDIRMRRDVDEKRPAAGIKVRSHEIGEGVVFDEQGVTVTAFLVDHGLLKPAFGYRIDHDGYSVVLSGDTRPSANLIVHAKGVDVLVREVVDSAAYPDAARRHTTAAQAGELFSKVRPRLAVYSHAPGGDGVVTQTRATYAGPLEAAEDMLTIEVGPTIEVHRFPH